MNSLEIEEGSWVVWLDSSGKEVRGQIQRIWGNKPFSEKNWWIYVPGAGNSHTTLDRIIKVYPKISIKFNPSSR